MLLIRAADATNVYAAYLIAAHLLAGVMLFSSFFDTLSGSRCDSTFSVLASASIAGLSVIACAVCVSGGAVLLVAGTVVSMPASSNTFSTSAGAVRWKKWLRKNIVARSVFYLLND